jgi:succinoglycan biosynthesis transport protein ExoP
VFKSEDLTGDYDVDLAGHISLPLTAANNVLFIVESGSTRTRAGIEALNRLEATGVHVLGAALTKAPADMAYGYGRYGYGYSYGQKALDRKRTEILMISQGPES